MKRACNIGGCDRPIIAGEVCTTHYNRLRKFGDPDHGGVLPPSGWGVCQVTGCDNAAGSSRLCPPHEARKKRNGVPTGGRKSPGDAAPECRAEGCHRPVRARGLCSSHYKRLRLYGDIMESKPFRLLNAPAEDRFRNYVEQRGWDDCWPWLAGTDPKGYGQFHVAGRRHTAAHRFAYELEYGSIPNSYQVHHLCNNKPCCNPIHLTAISAGEHTLIGNGFSGTNARKTYCKRGHELTPENCYDYTGKRDCKLCARIRARKQQK